MWIISKANKKRCFAYASNVGAGSGLVVHSGDSAKKGRKIREETFIFAISCFERLGTVLCFITSHVEGEKVDYYSNNIISPS